METIKVSKNQIQKRMLYEYFLLDIISIMEFNFQEEKISENYFSVFTKFI